MDGKKRLSGAAYRKKAKEKFPYSKLIFLIHYQNVFQETKMFFNGFHNVVKKFLNVLKTFQKRFLVRKLIFLTIFFYKIFKTFA